ncbi:MAG TPA: hypothetical protein VGE28_19350 [Pseudomonas sp.]
MAELTITIKDENGAIGVALAGDTGNETTAAFVAHALMRLVPEVVVGAARAAAKRGNCPCTKCSAKRDAAGQAESNELKPTLH